MSVDGPESTERLIRQLSGTVEPVRRVLPLWLRSAGVIAVACGVGLLFLLAGGSLDAAAFAARSGGPTGPVGAVALGLALAGLLGAPAALAEGVPGRERIVAVCGGIAGVAFAGGVVRAWVAWQAAGFDPGPGWPADRGCLQMALLLSVPTALVLAAVGARGWVARPVRTAAVSLAAAAALGGLAVHLGCSIQAARHLLVGHAGAVLVWSAAGTFPLAAWLRRRAR